MSVTVREALETYDRVLVEELLGAYEEAKRNYYLGGHRLSAVEGGRFCEAAYRILQVVTTETFTPIGEQLDTMGVANKLSGASAHPKSVRLHVPRALRVVYDIRNGRDSAHLADGIDPNLQDATLVVSVLDWVLAEFVRLGGRVSADVAQNLVDELVTRKLPVVQDFGTFPKVLRPNLPAGDYVLVLLYHVGADGAAVSDLHAWVPPSMRANLRRTVRTLEGKALVHQDDWTAFITFAGQKHVERRNLLDQE